MKALCCVCSVFAFDLILQIQSFLYIFFKLKKKFCSDRWISQREKERDVDRGDNEGESPTTWAILLWLDFFLAALLCLKLDNLHKYFPHLAREGATLLHPSNQLWRTLAPIQDYCSVGSSQWPDWRILSYRNNRSICWLVYKRRSTLQGRNVSPSFTMAHVHEEWHNYDPVGEWHENKENSRGEGMIETSGEQIMCRHETSRVY